MQSLIFSGLSKAYGGVPALADVNLQLTAGRVHALMGENGAGKSTLIKLIAGVISADKLQLEKDGKALELRNAQDAHDAGFRFIHQELNIVPQVSVAENILLGQSLPLRFGIAVDWPAVRAQARKALTFLGATHIDVSMLAGDLSTGDKMMMKIAAALTSTEGASAVLYVLDEPTAALTGEESEKLFDVIERLTRQGAAVLYVSHRMDEVLRICDDVTVLRDGRHVSTTAIAQTSKDEIIHAMTGRDVKDTYPPRQGAMASHTVLSLKNVSTTDLHDLNFEIKAGEVLGVSGLAEAGQSQLLQCLMGLTPITSGTAVFDGGPIAESPSEAWTNGVAYIPRERRTEALCLTMPIRSNIVLPFLASYGFKANKAAETRDARNVGDKVRLKCNNTEQAAEQLSGGNQQKVVFARALLCKPKLLLLDEPTRGVDVGAKYDIYLLLRELSEQGCAVILTSTDLPEILGMCDRVLVLHAGSQAHLLSRGSMSSADLLSHFYRAGQTG